MKRVVLLSAVTATILSAGGDILPVEPSVTAPASADFWGQIGFFYQAEDFDNANIKGVSNPNFGDKINNWFNATLVLGVDKQLGGGFGFGAEVAGWTDFGLDIGDRALFSSSARLIADWTDQTSAEVSQAYLTFVAGNTAIKAGRQALPKAISPWAWSDRTAGVIDISYDGVVLANTDLQDTTLVAAWIDQGVVDSYFGSNDVSDDAGLFMLAIMNKSIENTTLSASAYYVPSNNFTQKEDSWSIWASSEGNYGGVDAGAQFVYVDGDVAGYDATYAASVKLGSRWGDFDANMVAGYINDGDYSMLTAGSGIGTSAFWTYNGDFGGEIVDDNVWSVGVGAGYRMPVGKIFGNIGYWDADDNARFDTAYDAIAGYKFSLAGVDSKIEYRYLKKEGTVKGDKERQRIRVEAYYKF
jgi:hypothetical protein